MRQIDYTSFENLEESKKQSIINAGFKIFGENGYKKASIEDITKEANISKGSLFYYFASKKNFFLYLYEYSGGMMELLVDSPGEDGQPSYLKYTDFFERLNAIQLIKMQHSLDYPHMYNFMKKAVFEEETSIKSEITMFNQRYTTERAMLFFQDLDYFKFKEGIDPRMVIQLVGWCSEGCANQQLVNIRSNSDSTSTTPDFQEIFDLFQAYMKLLRNNFYKEEYL